ncbi:MAG TPA: transcriptional repressor LexA [Longimicrobiaceae bacterium]|nr:transcriptional repressor LexA [Longimicrobiaceae bacterium]
MREPLTKTEHRILDYLVDYLTRNTYQPSIREIGKRFSIKSTKTVSEHLQALADKGYIEREASRSRGVKILDLDLAREVVSVPSYGKIAAGQPALMPDHITDRFTIDPKLAGSPDAFFLQVAGESMEGMGMLDGDLVLVDPVPVDDLENGDIIAARLGGEGTVKRFFTRDGKIVLEPANPDFAPMFVHDYDDFVVLGRVTGLFRQFTPAQTKAIGG